MTEKSKLKCMRVNCGLDATHEFPFGEYCVAGFCDKHWNEHQNDPEAKERFSRVR